jgi:hypothetical protein
MTTISIHQPVYLPWLGFIEKIISSEKFVFLDDVQFEKNGFQNRNKIRTYDGEMWLTVPVKVKSQTLLKDVKINYSVDWINKHKKSIIQNYKKAEFFDNYWLELEKIYDEKYEYLVELNIEIIKFLFNKLKIKTKTLFSSELHISDKGSNRILEICKILNADRYISGISGKKYLLIDDFERQKIKLEFQNFQHPTYEQVFDPFYPNMAMIDLLFNEGDNALKIIKKGND